MDCKDASSEAQCLQGLTLTMSVFLSPGMSSLLQLWSNSDYVFMKPLDFQAMINFFVVLQSIIFLVSSHTFDGDGSPTNTFCWYLVEATFLFT